MTRRTYTRYRVPLRRRLWRWMATQWAWRPQYAWGLALTLVLSGGREWLVMHERLASLDAETARQESAVNREMDMLRRQINQVRRDCVPRRVGP